MATKDYPTTLYTSTTWGGRCKGRKRVNSLRRATREAICGMEPECVVYHLPKTLLICVGLIVFVLLSLQQSRTEINANISNVSNAVDRPQFRPRPINYEWKVLLTTELDVASRSRLAEAEKGLKSMNNTSHCSLTSSVLIFPGIGQKGDENSNRWVLQSLSPDGENKTIGGDEYYITWTHGKNENITTQEWMDHHNASFPTAVANVFDRNDGTYDLQFVIPPTPYSVSIPDVFDNTNSMVGTLKVTLQYSCGIGTVPQNEKKDWQLSGCLSFVYEKERVPAPRHLQQFIPPNDDSSASPSPERVNFTKYDKVVAVGDSVMRGFVVKNSYDRFAIRPETIKENSYYYHNIGAALASDQLGIFQRSISRDLMEFSCTTNNTALIINSAAWDIVKPSIVQGRLFKDHQKSLKKLIRWIRHTYPSVDIYWLSPMALHVHIAYQFHLTKYMSSSRAKYLYDVHKRITKEMNVTFLDLYSATIVSAEQH